MLSLPWLWGFSSWVPCPINAPHACDCLNTTKLLELTLGSGGLCSFLLCRYPARFGLWSKWGEENFLKCRWWPGKQVAMSSKCKTQPLLNTANKLLQSFVLVDYWNQSAIFNLERKLFLFCIWVLPPSRKFRVARNRSSQDFQQWFAAVPIDWPRFTRLRLRRRSVCGGVAWGRARRNSFLVRLLRGTGGPGLFFMNELNTSEKRTHSLSQETQDFLCEVNHTVSTPPNLKGIRRGKTLWTGK